MPPAKHEAIVKHLRNTFPEATEAECQRFAACRNVSFEDDNGKLRAEAIESLEDYLKWRKKYRMDDVGEVPKIIDGNASDMDQKLWACVCHRTQDALDRMAGETTKSIVSSARTTTPSDLPPQFIFFRKLQQKSIVDKRGNKILHVLPAMIDTKNVTAEVYGITLLYYLDCLLSRDSNDKMTVLLDVRPGRGWPNPLAVFMINFVRKIAKMLQGRFPGRLEQLIVFPVPKAALHVFYAMQWVFHAELSEKIILVPGSAERRSPLPKQCLQEYISDEILDFTEQARIDAFIRK
jgi:hypothetical protein